MIEIYNRFLSGWFSGDPHIVTLDGLKYTFNGLGEYHLIQSNNTAIHARTSRALNQQGELVNATVFSAIAVKDSNAERLHVQMNTKRESKLFQ